MEFFNQAFQSDDVGSFMLIAFCLVASAFFSASETAITSINHLKAKHLLEQKGEKLSTKALVGVSLSSFNDNFDIQQSC